jgi:tRNA (adenine57-N1/adenine58-N1)-methyltransferase
VVKIKVLIDKEGRKFLVEVGEFHTDLGVLKIEESEDNATSHLGHEFRVLDPDIVDIYEKMPRSGSFMLKKDIGFFLTYMGIGGGHNIVDAGTGSGSLAIFMGNIVRLGGGVVSYEKNPEFSDIARRNIEKAGLHGVVEIITKDVLEGFNEDDGSIDAVTLDLHEGWKLIGESKRILKVGGRIGLYTPYLEHAREVNLKLLNEGFTEILTVESITREMEFKKQGSRPKTSRVGHSGYLSFGRKI